MIASLFKNTVFILLKPRLKTLDTIIPILIQDKSKSQVFFYSPNEYTTRSIKLNVVLNDCMNHAGKLIYFYEEKNKSFYYKIKKKINLIILSLYLILKIFLNKADFIYFEDLNGKKYFLKFLKYNVFLCENDPYGHTKFILKTKQIEEYKLLGKEIKKGEFKMPKQNLILFSKNYYNLDINKNNDKVNFWAYSNLRLSEEWLSYIIKNKNFYINKDFKNNNIEHSDKFITICLGPLTKEFGWDKTGKIMKDLLTESIESILSLNLNIPIFIKPYPLPDNEKNFINEDILYNILNKTGYKKFVISYLHPMILAQNSIFMLANSNTSTFADFKIFNVPTIEYTHYSDLLLKETNNKSVRPDWADYFINHDKQELNKCLNNIIKNKYENKNISNFKIDRLKQRNNYLLINRLNGNNKTIFKNMIKLKTF